MKFTIIYTRVLKDTHGQKVGVETDTREDVTSLQLSELFGVEIPMLAEGEAFYKFGVEFDDGSDGKPVIDQTPSWVYHYIATLCNAAYNILVNKGKVQVDLEALSISVHVNQALMNDNFIVVSS